MHKLIRLAAANLARSLTYRGDILLWSFAESAAPLISLAIWFNVSKSGTSPLTPTETLTYYVLIMFTVAITDAWSGLFLSREILEGKIVQYLTKPVGFFWFYLSRKLSAKFIRIIPYTIVLIGVLYFIGDQLQPTIYHPINIGLYLASATGGLTIAFLIDMVFAMLAFWLEDALEIREYKELLFTIASGLLIPFAFMPPFLQFIFSWLPFRYILAAPVEIIMSQTPVDLAMRVIVIQAAWIAVTAIALRVLWHKGLKVYAVPGQ